MDIAEIYLIVNFVLNVILEYLAFFVCSIFHSGLVQLWQMSYSFVLFSCFSIHLRSVKTVQIRSFFWSVLSYIRTEYGDLHCVKSVQIQRFFWSVFFCIRTEYRRIRTRKDFVFWYFWHACLKSKNMKHW